MNDLIYSALGGVAVVALLIASIALYKIAVYDHPVDYSVQPCICEEEYIPAEEKTYRNALNATKGDL